MWRVKNRPKIGSNIKVETIRSLKNINRIKTLLIDNPRDLAIFVLGINTNLRANDIVKITVGQVKHLFPGDNLILREEKTNEIRRITINKAAYEAIQNLLTAIQDKKDDAALFQSRKSKSNLTVPYLNYLVKKWCSLIRLKGNYGSLTLRKTFGYIQFTHFKTDILSLMMMFNHSSPKQTLSYIGIRNPLSLAGQKTGLTEENTDIIKTNFRERMNHIYYEYQNSYIWHNVVKAVIERDNKTCQDCGKQPKIGIAHHTSYQNWVKGNNEESRDCVYLCKECHNARHKKNGDEPTPFWALRMFNPDLDTIEDEDIAKLFMQEI